LSRFQDDFAVTVAIDNAGDSVHGFTRFEGIVKVDMPVQVQFRAEILD